MFEVDKEKGLVLTEIAENEDIPSIVGATNCEFVVRTYTIPVNLSDPHGRRSPAIENEKAGDLVRRLF